MRWDCLPKRGAEDGSWATRRRLATQKLSRMKALEMLLATTHVFAQKATIGEEAGAAALRRHEGGSQGGAAGGRRRAGCKASACKHARSSQRRPLQHPRSPHLAVTRHRLIRGSIVANPSESTGDVPGHHRLYP